MITLFSALRVLLDYSTVVPERPGELIVGLAWPYVLGPKTPPQNLIRTTRKICVNTWVVKCTTCSPSKVLKLLMSVWILSDLTPPGDWWPGFMKRVITRQRIEIWSTLPSIIFQERTWGEDSSPREATLKVVKMPKHQTVVAVDKSKYFIAALDRTLKSYFATVSKVGYLTSWCLGWQTIHRSHVCYFIT